MANDDLIDAILIRLIQTSNLRHPHATSSTSSCGMLRRHATLPSHNTKARPRQPRATVRLKENTTSPSGDETI